MVEDTYTYSKNNMKDDIQEKKIVVFGAGRRGDAFLLQNKEKYEISIAFDNRKEGYVCGCKIQKPYYSKDFFIIVAVDGYEPYYAIKKQLEELSYKEFIDFVPYSIWSKKMAVAYGNCHMTVVKDYLESSNEFSSIYGFYPFPAIQQMESEYDYSDIISHCDLFLHQSIQENNAYGVRYASCYFLKYANNAQVIAIPNLYGLPKCFFPQLRRGEEYKDFNGHELMMAVDINIRNWVINNCDTKQIVEKLQNECIYSKQEIVNQFKAFVDKVKEREEQWDIKILGYILENYKTQKLFTEPWHISSELAKEIADRILDYLGMIRTDDFIIPCLDDFEVFIYNDVKIALGIVFDEKIIRKYTRITSCVNKISMNLEKYVEMNVDLHKMN